MLTVHSSTGYADTLGRLLEAIKEHGLTVFAQVDHAAGAHTAGLELASEMLVVFGNPRAGTALMQADPRIGIELPLRMLVWDGDGAGVIGYNDPRELRNDYEVAEHAATLEAMSALLADLARAAAA